MAAKWIEYLTGSFEDKRRWRAYKARVAALPAPYRKTTDGIERYLMYSGAIVDGTIMLKMLDDLADLMEASAADATPVRDVVGEDPVEFADAFLANYSDGQWINKEKQRLADTVARAQEEAGDPDGPH